MVGDWSVSGIYSLHGGFPLTISAGDASGTKSRGARANCIAPANVFGTQNSPSGGYQWFDPNSYSDPSPHTFGTCGVGTVRGPGFKLARSESAEAIYYHGKDPSGVQRGVPKLDQHANTKFARMLDLAQD